MWLSGRSVRFCLSDQFIVCFQWWLTTLSLLSSHLSYPHFSCREYQSLFSEKEGFMWEVSCFTTYLQTCLHIPFPFAILFTCVSVDPALWKPPTYLTFILFCTCSLWFHCLWFSLFRAYVPISSRMRMGSCLITWWRWSWVCLLLTHIK